MKLENIRASGKYVLVEVDGGSSVSSSGFRIADDGLLSVGKVLSAGADSGLGEYTQDIKVFFETEASVDIGFGFNNVKLVHSNSVLAIDLGE